MILVTGATGNVGRELVPLLAAGGTPVRALVRDSKVASDARIEWVKGDLERPETLVSAMKGIEGVYTVSPMTEQIAHLISAAKTAGVRHFVKQSTIEADRSLGPGKWHREQELMIERSGMDWTFLRPTLMMSNVIQWWGHTIETQGRVYFPGGNGKAAPVDPRDIAVLACAVLTQPGHVGRTYDVTGPELLSAREMVQVLSKVLQKRIQYVRTPIFVAALAMRRFGASWELTDAIKETFGAWDRNEYASVSDAVERVTGIKPRTFEVWCRDHHSSFVRE